MFRKIIKIIKGIWYYTWGHLFAFFLYDKKYLRGKYFEGKLGGLCCIGWKWVVDDTFGNFILKQNKGVPWPVSPKITIVLPENITFDVDDLNNFQGFGNYFQALGKIEIGKDTWIAGNVGIITANHMIGNLKEHTVPKPVIIGKKCWIGMNSVILPGITLGDNTVVGAGAVVTKSFPEGDCIIGGNPAKIIRYIRNEGNNETDYFKENKHKKY